MTDPTQGQDAPSTADPLPTDPDLTKALDNIERVEALVARVEALLPSLTPEAIAKVVDERIAAAIAALPAPQPVPDIASMLADFGKTIDEKLAAIPASAPAPDYEARFGALEAKLEPHPGEGRGGSASPSGSIEARVSKLEGDVAAFKRAWQ